MTAITKIRDLRFKVPRRRTALQRGVFLTKTALALAAALTLAAPPAASAQKGGKGQSGGGGGRSGATEASNFTVDSATHDSLNSSWQTGGTGTAGYLLAYSSYSTPRKGCSSGTVIDVGLIEAYDLSSLNSETTYYLRLCAYDAGGSTLNGQTAQGTTTTVPRNPPPPPPDFPNDLWSGQDIQLQHYFGVKFDELSNRTYYLGTTTENVTVLEARIPSTGELDSTFASQGRLYLANSEDAYDLDVDSNGNIYTCSRGTEGATSGLIVKIDPNGAVVWSQILFNYSCSNIEVHNENGVDYLYAHDIEALKKFDTSGNLQLGFPFVFNGTSGVWMNLNSKHFDVSDSGAYILYTINDEYVVSRIDPIGNLVNRITFPNLHFANGKTEHRSGALTIGQSRGQEYIWIIPRHETTITRLNPDLSPSPSTCCNGFDLTTIDHHLLAYDMRVVTEGTREFLYVAGRRHQDAGLEHYDTIISRWELTSDGNCDSQNEAGEPYDIDNFAVNWGEFSETNWDSYTAFDFDSQLNIFTVGYADYSLFSNTDFYTTAFGVFVTFQGGGY